MSVEAVQLNDKNEEDDEEEEASTSSSLSISQTWTSLPSSINDESEDKTLMSPSLCKQGILKHFEALVNQLSTGWKYHVANTDGIKDSWLKFEDFYSNVCQFTGGL